MVKVNWDDDDDDDNDDAGGHIANNNKESMKKDKEISTLEVKLQVVGKEKSVDKAPNMRKKISIEDDYQENKEKSYKRSEKLLLTGMLIYLPRKGGGSGLMEKGWSGKFVCLVRNISIR